MDGLGLENDKKSVDVEQLDDKLTCAPVKAMVGNLQVEEQRYLACFQQSVRSAVGADGYSHSLR